MYPQTNTNRNQVNPILRSRVRRALDVTRLTSEDEGEVVAFLNERPAHTFGMAGFIRTNGIVSVHNQGEFYGCRNKRGDLEGVALIGRYILFETRSDAATKALAIVAQDCRTAHMLLGEQEQVETFWSYYADGGKSPRLYSREYLLEQRCPVAVNESVPELRLATPDDLDLIVPAHAEIAFEESGIDPLQSDPEGFRRRCARRIEQGQSWVLVENGRLLFKAEVISDTPETAYLEGVWVDPQERGNGIGLRCMSQLSRTLLQRSKSVCLLVNERFQRAQAFYRKAGFSFISHYDTVYLSQQVH